MAKTKNKIIFIVFIGIDISLLMTIIANIIKIIGRQNANDFGLSEFSTFTKKKRQF